MSKRIGIIIGILILLLIGGAVAYTQLNKSSQAPQPTTVGEEKTQTPETMTKGSLKSLLTMGKNTTCTISYSANQMETKGTVYIAGKKMRVDYTIKATDNKEMGSHMITDEMYMYSWSSAGPQGVKIKIDETPQITPSPGAESQTQTAQLDQEVDYKCSPWAADDSKFTPPSNVKFTDMSSMMKTQPSGTTQNNQAAICDQIENPEAKASCLKAVSGQ